MVGLNFDRALEIGLGAIEIAVVEEHLAEEERELVVVAVETEGFLEMLDAALGIESVERRLGIGDQDEKALALLAAEQRDHAVLALDEALLLFESEHLLAHLRFPQLDHLVGGEHVLLLEQFLDREKTGLIDEDGALVLLHGVYERADGFRGTLDDLLDSGHALE